MRIAISGASFCGKTTLANDLGDHLGVAVIPEYYGETCAVNADVSPKVRMERYQAILKAKRALENETVSGFVSDRSPVDLAFHWHNQGLSMAFPTESRVFLEACRGWANTLDAIIFPPGPDPEVGAQSSFGPGARIWELWRNHNAMIGLAYRWLPMESVCLMPDNISVREDRLAWVLAKCASRGIAAN